jgi:hypothetical protein
MARRGRCRCGNILTFQRGPDGYKVRCPVCQAVVRLSKPGARKAEPQTGHCTACGAAVAVAAGESMVLCAACRGAVGEAVARIPVEPIMPPPDPLPPLEFFGSPPPAAADNGPPPTPGAESFHLETTPYEAAAPQPLPALSAPTPGPGGRIRWWLVAAVALIMSAVVAVVIWLCQR